MGRACGRNAEKRKVYRLLVGKPEGKIAVGRPKRKWVVAIKLGLREKECGGMD
jgi:hypothetical protein